MKWVIYPFIAVLILSCGIFYRLNSEIKHRLEIHSLEDRVDSPLGKNAEIKYFVSSSNQKLAYWYFPVKNAKAVIILAHGFANPGGKSQMIVHTEYLKKAGYTTIIPDLRSFGDSEGNKIYLGTKEWQDLIDTYNLVKSFPENKDKKIGYLGVSMGAASSITAVAQSGQGDFIIASVPFKSFDSLAEFRLKNNKYFSFIRPFIKISGLSQLGLSYPRYSAINNIGQVHIPVLIFQATKDEFINKQDSQDIYNLANNPKEFWQADSSHDIHYQLPKDFEQRVLNFLDKYL